MKAEPSAISFQLSAGRLLARSGASAASVSVLIGIRCIGFGKR